VGTEGAGGGNLECPSKGKGDSERVPQSQESWKKKKQVPEGDLWGVRGRPELTKKRGSRKRGERRKALGQLIVREGSQENGMNGFVTEVGAGAGRGGSEEVVDIRKLVPSMKEKKDSRGFKDVNF